MKLFSILLFMCAILSTPLTASSELTARDSLAKISLTDIIFYVGSPEEGDCEPECRCIATDGGTTNNGVEKCPCQRIANCSLPPFGNGKVVSLCCSIFEDETDCLTVEMSPVIRQRGCCIDPDTELPACTDDLATSCSWQFEFEVTMTVCCQADSNLGGVGFGGSVDCSAAACCVGNSYRGTDSEGDQGNTHVLVPGNTTFTYTTAYYLPCGVSSGSGYSIDFGCATNGSGGLFYPNASGLNRYRLQNPVCYQCIRNDI